MPPFTQHLSPEPKALFKSKFCLRWEGASLSSNKDLNIKKEPEFQHERGKVD